MKPRPTTAAAIAVALAAFGLVAHQLRSGPDETEPPSLSRAQDALLNQRREARSTRRRDPVDKSSIASWRLLYAQLLKEFPELRSDPPLANENNAIHRLNELSYRISMDGFDLRADLHRLMGPNAQWDLEASQALLKRYQWVIDELTKIAALGPGSHTYFEGSPNPFWNGPLGLIPLLDLMRLKTRTNAATRGHPTGADFKVADGDIIDDVLNRHFLAQIIKRSEGASIVHILMAESSEQAALDDPRDEQFYNGSVAQENGLNPYLVNDYLYMPYWGADLSSSMLARQARRYWSEELMTINPFLPELDPADPDAGRAYARHVSEVISRLEQEGLEAFLVGGFPAVETRGLSALQQELVEIRSMGFDNQLRHMVALGMQQHQAMIGIRVHESEGSRPLAGDTDYFDPVTNSAYRFDPETRLLSRGKQIEGYDVWPIPIREPGREEEVILMDPVPFLLADPEK